MKNNLLTILVFAVLIGLFALSANDWKLPGWGPSRPEGVRWCGVHDVELAKCAPCNPDLARGGTKVMSMREPEEGECPNTLVQIKLAPGVATQMNLRLHTVKSETIAETVRANGETEYLPSKYARVAPRIPGVIRETLAVLGDSVEAGAPLAILESPDYASAKSDFWQAQDLLELRRETYRQQEELARRGIVTERDKLKARIEFREAELALERAEHRLSALGIVARELQDRDTSARMPVSAPFAGVVVQAAAVPGETASPERPIFAIADASRFWVCVDVYEPDLPKIQKDQKAVFLVDSLFQRFPGRVVAVGSEVNEQTRTGRVYAEVKNIQGLLKARMFGRVEITIRSSEPKLLVPKDAVQNEGDCTLVFVTPMPDVFQARKVELGACYGNGFEVKSGLAEGESVVTVGSFQLKTEVLKGQMGVG